MKKRIFISYTSKDPAVSEERLKAVDAKLKPFASVFIDRLHNKKGGQHRVNWELWRCDALIQLVSVEYQSEWTQKELMTARKKRKPVVKITIDDLLKKDEEDIFLLLDEMEKNRWSVWSILTVAILVCVGISFLGIWLSYLYVSKPLVVTDLMTARGVFGDSWGGVNAIISAFAFAGVIVTLFLQNRDLNLQRKEMARQREEFEKENETLKYQRFENTFFNMLSQFQEVVNNLKVIKGEYSGEGRSCFEKTYEKNEAEEIMDDFDYLSMYSIILRYGVNGYKRSDLPKFFDHYFRLLYRILKFVDESKLITDFDEKYEYTAMLRAMLSRYELVWLYYNGLSPYGEEKLKPLIERYAMLNNLRRELLVKGRAQGFGEYKESAYKKTSPVEL